jgi:hypothetical protein
MIKGLMGNQGVIVSGGDTSLPYVNPNPNNPMTGMLRINNTNIEVFTGNAWQIVNSSYATVSLDPDTQDLLQWVRTQRTLELNRQTLMKNNPALEKAYEAMKRAEDNFDILATIAGKYEHVER